MFVNKGHSTMSREVIIDDENLPYTATTLQDALEEIGSGGGGSLVNKVQTKILSIDAITDTQIVEIEFNNLVTNNWYEIIGQISMSLDGGVANYRVYCNIHNSGIYLAQPYLRINESTDNKLDILTMAVAIVFKATGPKVTFTPGFAAASSAILGNGTKKETYMVLTERNDLTETTDFT